MSENVWYALMSVTGVISVVFFMAMFAGTPSNFQTFVDAWRQKQLAETEVKKLEAEHLQKCPRLTDTPRRNS